MEWSAERVDADQPDEPTPAVPLVGEAREFDASTDAYATAELERRKLRTEVMIAKARRLS